MAIPRRCWTKLSQLARNVKQIFSLYQHCRQTFCSQVFGPENVFTGVKIYESKSKILGEIDVLVKFANRIIVLQAKSKRLTIESRKGNDGQIKDDFKKGIQGSYDQGFACAELIQRDKINLVASDSRVVTFEHGVRDVYILCVLSDHYPALSFQARQFLKFNFSSNVRHPFVLDIFTLDAMAEMLQSPLYFLSYLDRRVSYAGRLIASDELTILSYHLKYNLWLDDDCGGMCFSDDIATDLDVAMTVRRRGIKGDSTPDGILTRFSATSIGSIIKDIENNPSSVSLDLGFVLLKLSEETFIEASNSLDKIIALAKKDHKNHTLTIGLSSQDTGIVIYCNDSSTLKARVDLYRHCEWRKYKEKVNTWFGINLRPNVSLRYCFFLNNKWQPSNDLSEKTKNIQLIAKASGAAPSNTTQHKVGRNSLCPCGSGIKYKKCCLIKSKQR